MEKAFPLDLAPQFSPMTQADVDPVMELEYISFPTPWSASTYRSELRNRNSSYWVVRPGPARDAAAAPSILGYGGMWLMGDEAHITTLAVHPDLRRRHLGEWLLLQLIGAARARGARLVTLEARVGNAPALALYRKLGFKPVGLRRGYYQDTGEDAQLLTLFAIDSPVVWRKLVKRRQAIEDGPAQRDSERSEE
jgi:ribosomal-protein-alanine N-acetyltransferase